MWSIPTIRLQPSWQKSSTAAKRPTGAANCSSRSSHPWRTFRQDLQLKWIKPLKTCTLHQPIKVLSFIREVDASSECMSLSCWKFFQFFLTQSSLSPGQHCGLPVFHDFVFIIGASANTMKLLEWQPAMLAMRISLPRWGRFVRDPRNCGRDPGGRHGVTCKFSFFHQEHTWRWECRPHLLLPRKIYMRLNICMGESFFNEMPYVCGNAYFCQGHDVPSDMINLISKELQIK